MLGQGVQLEDPTESVSLDKARTLWKNAVTKMEQKHISSLIIKTYNQKRGTILEIATYLCWWGKNLLV